MIRAGWAAAFVDDDGIIRSLNSEWTSYSFANDTAYGHGPKAFLIRTRISTDPVTVHYVNVGPPRMS